MEWLAIQPRERGQFRVGGVIGKKRLGGLRQPIGAVFYRALQLLAQLMHCGFDNFQPAQVLAASSVAQGFLGRSWFTILSNNRVSSCSSPAVGQIELKFVVPAR